MVHLIPARRQDVVLINKKKRNCYLVGFPVPMHHKRKKKNKQIPRY